MSKNIRVFGKWLLLSVLATAGMAAAAAPVSKATALRLAENLWARCKQEPTQWSLVDAPYENIYVVGNSNGFVLVSKDDCVLPVVGYSTSGAFPAAEVPDNMHFWLSERSNEIQYCIDHQSTPTEKIRTAWERLLNDGGETPQSTAVAPLILTTWSQGPYYNYICPYDTTIHDFVPTGSVATAMAQIMRKWQYPPMGFGAHSYTHPTYGLMSENFSGTIYNWSTMALSYTNTTGSTSIGYVAGLMRACGIAVETNYGPRKSTAPAASRGYIPFCAEHAFSDFFGYSKQVSSIYKSDYTDSAWMSDLEIELLAGNPILYTAVDSTDGSHSFVCDGCDSSGRMHFNWGWGGSGNGYYAVTSLNPLSYHYTHDHTAIINITPDRSLLRVSKTEWNSGVNRDSMVCIIMPSQSSLPWLAITDQSWLTVSQYTGAGRGANATIKAYTTQNRGPMARMGTIYVIQGTDTVRISVMQDYPDGIIDTLHFDNGNLRTATRGDSAFWWGIRLKPQRLLTLQSMVAAQLYVGNLGTYQLKVYEGNDSTPVSLMASVSRNIVNRGWQTFPLPDSLIIDTARSLWITFYNDDAENPALMSDYGHDRDGSWYSNDSITWLNTVDSGIAYSYMIRGIFHRRINIQYGNISVTSNDNTRGSVRGEGTFPLGYIDTLFAIPDSGYRFWRWNDGDNSNPRIVPVRGDAAFIALFMPVCGQLVSHDSVSVCDGYTWNNRRYTQSGVYDITLRDSVDCDSVAYLHLNIRLSTSEELDTTVCDSLVWHGSRFYTRGIKRVRLLNAARCDSIVTIYLTVNHSSHGTTRTMACDEYYWGGRNYTQSGTYYNHGINNAGCPARDTLVLTINHNTYSDQRVTACDKYKWRNVTFTNNTNSYYTVGHNSVGCDSIVHLILTILHGGRSEFTATSTGAYTWRGHTYTTSGNYTDTILAHNGCDSILILHLTITSPNGIDDACDASDILVWPNPTTGYLTIRSSQPISKTELFDMSGRSVTPPVERQSDGVWMDMTAMPRGVYMLRITLPDGTVMRKVVKR